VSPVWMILRLSMGPPELLSVTDRSNLIRIYSVTVFAILRDATSTVWREGVCVLTPPNELLGLEMLLCWQKSISIPCSFDVNIFFYCTILFLHIYVLSISSNCILFYSIIL